MLFVIFTAFLNFLSRLCGGEDGEVKLAQYSDFLSRLCGGEALQTASA